MIIRWFKDTDTAYLEFASSAVAETRPVSEDVLAELDAQGRVVALTVEHASEQLALPNVVLEQVDRGAA